MTIELNQMKGEELVTKVLEGERDFSGIKLQEGFDLSGYEGFVELQNYLKVQNLKKAPIIINDSELRYVRAKGLYLPFVKARNTDLRGTVLSYANLENADFENANLANTYSRDASFENGDFRNVDLSYAKVERANVQNADFSYANFWWANFKNANFKNAKLKYAYLGNADLENAYLENADLENAMLWWVNLKTTNLKNANLRYAHLRGLRNLEESFNLEFANFMKTRVTLKEKTIIESALSRRRLFVVDR